jgi:hypothetical protein
VAVPKKTPGSYNAIYRRCLVFLTKSQEVLEEDYYSPAIFFQEGIDSFGMLKHFS